MKMSEGISAKQRYGARKTPRVPFRRTLTVPALALITAFLLPAPAAQALECYEEDFRRTTYSVCKVDLRLDDLRLWHHGPDGVPYYNLGAIADAMAEKGGALSFGMNAGMYHEDRAPVGLLRIEGKSTGRLITRAGPGNFGLLPNGVFCWGSGRGAVIESRTFARKKPRCRFATQSGPMLVIGGKLHPKFGPNSTSRYVRNGVGVVRGGRYAVFAMSRSRVNFHNFASFFRDRLKTPNALYLDGNVSRLYAPSIGRTDRGGRFGPIVGVALAKPPPIPVPKPERERSVPSSSNDRHRH